VARTSCRRRGLRECSWRCAILRRGGEILRKRRRALLAFAFDPKRSKHTDARIGETRHFLRVDLASSDKRRPKAFRLHCQRSRVADQRPLGLRQRAFTAEARGKTETRCLNRLASAERPSRHARSIRDCRTDAQRTDIGGTSQHEKALETARNAPLILPQKMRWDAVDLSPGPGRDSRIRIRPWRHRQFR
jgi:hypothetical protein